MRGAKAVLAIAALLAGVGWAQTPRPAPTNGAATGVLPVGTPVLLSEQVVSGTAATVTFSSIPGTYRNLWLVVQGRCDASSVAVDIYLQFNSDTAANYSRQYIFGTSTTVTAGQTTGNAKAPIGTVTCATASANYPGSVAIDIPNYSGTTFYKTAYGRTTYVNGATIAFLSIANNGFVWANTNAITSIVVGLASAGNFITGSTFDLYAQ